jgi:iron complex outermembrane receptor protein
LKPENAISSEFGYRFQKSNFLGKVNVFNRSSDNAINWVKESEDGIWVAENIAEIKTNGVEGNA